MALKTPEVPVRKSFLIGGAAIVAVAVLAFVLSTFVFGGSGSSNTVAAPSASPSSVQPATSGGTATVPAPAQGFPKNVLKSGGADPFVPKVSGVKPQAPAAPAASAPAAEPGSQPGLDAVDLATLHTWQLLDFAGGKATFLVDGKKHAKLTPGDKIVEGYTYNSVTGECVTIKKGGGSIFGLCPGAAPFAQ